MRNLFLLGNIGLVCGNHLKPAVMICTSLGIIRDLSLEKSHATTKRTINTDETQILTK